MKDKIKNINLCISLCHKIIEHIPKKHKEVRNIIVISIYMSIIDLSEDIVYLIDDSRFTSFPIIMRRIHESMIDLLLIESDFGYINSLLLQYAKDAKEVYQPYLDPSNSLYVKENEKRKEIQNHLKIMKSGPVGNDDKKYSILEPSRKISLVNGNQILKRYYKNLSYDVHGNLSAIERNHIRFGEDGRVRLVYGKRQADEHMNIERPLISSLITSSMAVNSILNINLDSEIQKVVDGLIGDGSLSGARYT